MFLSGGGPGGLIFLPFGNFRGGGGSGIKFGGGGGFGGGGSFKGLVILVYKFKGGKII